MVSKWNWLKNNNFYSRNIYHSNTNPPITSMMLEMEICTWLIWNSPQQLDNILMLIKPNKILKHFAHFYILFQHRWRKSANEHKTPLTPVIVYLTRSACWLMLPFAIAERILSLPISAGESSLNPKGMQNASSFG